MRHVDDAHLAEGDGKSDSGEQQHRAEADAEDQVLHGSPQRQTLLDPLDAGIRCGSHGRRGIGGQRAQQRGGIVVAAIAQGLHGRDRSASGASGMARRSEARASCKFTPRRRVGLAAQSASRPSAERPCRGI